MSLKVKFILSSVLGLTLVISLGAWYLSQLQARNFEKEVSHRAELVLAFGKACRSYAKKTLRPKVDELTDVFIIEAMSSTYLTSGIFDFLNEKFPNYQYRQPTLNPLNSRNQADAYEADIIKVFAADNTLETVEGYRTLSDGQEQFYIARPVVVEAKCLTCHGNPDEAPAAVTKRYGRDHGFGWKEGEVASALMISVPTDDLHAAQWTMMRTILGTFGGLLVLITIIIFILFRKIVDRRIRNVSRVMRQVAEDPQTSARIEDTQKDEIAMIATVFNHTADSLKDTLNTLEDRVRERTAELEQTHDDLVEASYRAGTAEEVATNILHNVGNVLNTVSLSTSLILEQVRDSEIADLIKIAELLDLHSSDMAAFLTEDLQGQHIPAYLSEVGKVLGEEQTFLLEKTETLSKSVEHITEIIQTQQSFVGKTRFEVAACISDLIKDSIEINQNELEKVGVDLTCEVADLPEMMFSKHQVIQILVNLIANAKDATIEQKVNTKHQVRLVCYRKEDRLYIEVQDDGIGIAKENLVKIFRHGFTTKQTGHGFGLHSAALAAKEMGGSLSVQSEGVGKGTTFILELPVKLVKVATC